MTILVAKSAIESHDYDYALRLLTSVTDPGEFSEHSELLAISLVRCHFAVISTKY